MIKAKYLGKKSYKVDEFNASSGNTVFMSSSQWEEIKDAGDKELFKVLEEDDKAFPKQVRKEPEPVKGGE